MLAGDCQMRLFVPAYFGVACPQLLDDALILFAKLSCEVNLHDAIAVE
jgi:hypothetical protein